MGPDVFVKFVKFLPGCPFNYNRSTYPFRLLCIHKSSFLRSVLKIFQKMLYARIYKKCEAHFVDAQIGFRSGLGTIEALMKLHVLLQRCRDISVDVYACFIDYEQAFDYTCNMTN